MYHQIKSMLYICLQYIHMYRPLYQLIFFPFYKKSSINAEKICRNVSKIKKK